MKFGSSNSFMLYPSPKISPRTRRIGIYYRYNFCNWKTLPTLFQNTFVPFLCIFLWESFEKFDFLNFNPYGGPFGKASVFQVAVLNRKLMDTTNIPFSSHPLRVEFEEDERVNTFLPNLSHCQLMWQYEEKRHTTNLSSEASCYLTLIAYPSKKSSRRRNASVNCNLNFE